ncbi:hypothetical protein VPHG_00089 [Vibrio phage 11895-B1]|uniref:hypothetical protein n=1 Tax=Vibrio phage 11895-B1 TaxID=754075 RepID=UPI0002C0EB32|nr:hypothetical protein VPHG_00089 [Vibrio phage 11895-B1]AGH32156.1 hypothetical protein VPHG_00089 [Vibrio phage 11895-B1]
MKSLVDYHDIRVGDDLKVVEFMEAHTETRKDGNDVEQKLDIYKVVLPDTTKIHYLYTFEISVESETN